MKEYTTIQFNPAEKKFLAKYAPEDDMFTSNIEIKQVAEALSLEGKHYDDLCAIRNSVVEYYSNRMELDQHNHKKVMAWMTSMQSVTAVIDEYKHKYGEV